MIIVLACLSLKYFTEQLWITRQILMDRFSVGIFLGVLLLATANVICRMNRSREKAKFWKKGKSSSRL